MSSISSKAPPHLNRIKLGQAASSNPATRPLTGKHPLPGHSRANSSGTKSRPPPLPSPTSTAGSGGSGAGGGANGVSGSTRLSERRRIAYKPGAGQGKGKGGSIDDKTKVAAVDAEVDGDSIIVRQPQVGLFRSVIWACIGADIGLESTSEALCHHNFLHPPEIQGPSPQPCITFTSAALSL
jgi:hypothetical protein